MITNSDITATSLSATKKDFYQIWNELLDIAKKLSDRWDPTSTNESDPGIVLLKVVTAVADKLNYNIDKNILEAFMPSAAQEESMRKLCDMLGYNIKYYQSAATTVTMSYVNSEKDLPIEGLVIPQFLTITNADKDVNYIVINESKLISNDNKTITLNCIEGQIVACESDNDNIISMAQMDDNNRYYLPETQIAENGIFIYKVNDGILDQNRWTKVENLNTQQLGTYVYKFGYDSNEARPYIQFPDDIDQIIGDGLLIYYTRTSGVNGNISARILSTFEAPTSESWQDYTAEDFSVTNSSATATGRNIETITQSYNNYKKVIGTFDTLITCRDYMNKIYNLISSNDVPLVSNIIVSDIRDDINNAVTICSFNDYGISYLEKSLLGIKDGEEEESDLINHFDLMLYPFKTVYGLNNYKEYTDSFKYTDISLAEIKAGIAENKTISHNIRTPGPKDIICIKNYLKLNAKITTINKVNIAEETAILTNIKEAIYTAFNMRQLDFGEEIPFDTILSVIENADSRIKNVSLDEPTLYTKFLRADGEEFDLASTANDGSNTTYPGREIYNKLALRNILAGRVELFNYDTSFRTSLNEQTYGNNISPLYPIDNKKIVKLGSECIIRLDDSDSEDIEDLPVFLGQNEVIKFRAPNFKTTITYPAYVNYYLHLDNDSSASNIPATFYSLRAFLEEDTLTAPTIKNWQAFMNYIQQNGFLDLISSETWGPASYLNYGAAFDNNYQYVKQEDITNGQVYNIIKQPASSTFVIYNNFIKSLRGKDGNNLNGLYRFIGQAQVYGYLVSDRLMKYQQCTMRKSQDNLDTLAVQETHDTDSGTYTADGLGRGATLTELPANCEYQLKGGDYLLINYTPSSTNADGTTATVQPENIYYKKGTIIKPNFALVDSNSLHVNTGKSWSKTVGFDFSKYDVSEPAGMFGLGANEQIEIREPVEIKLHDQITNLYWILNTTKATGTAGTTTKITLQPNEYIFYTDQYKTAMAYYGAGTEVILNNVVLPAINAGEEISIEDILEEGVSAIPWRQFYLNENTANVVLKEYQYVTLTHGDSLTNIELALEPKETAIINNEWKNCTAASYVCAGANGALPEINILDENNNPITWQVRSLLEFNVSPTTAQILGPAAVKTGTEEEVPYVRDYITVYTKTDPASSDPANEYKLCAGNSRIPLAIKTNYAIQASTDTVDTAFVYNVDSENNVEYVYDLQIKTFKELNTKLANNSLLAFNNLSNTWTTLYANQLPTTEPGAQFAINIPNNKFGLLLIYVNDASIPTAGEKEKHAWFTISSETTVGPVIYNYNSSSDQEGFDPANYNPAAAWTWWKDCGPTKGKYYLHTGLNIIQFTKSTTLSFYTDASEESKSVLLAFGNLDIVKQSFTDDKYGINLALLDYQANASTPTMVDKSIQLLKDIYKIDGKNREFYYNCLIDNSQAIEVNQALLGTDDAETLSSPRTWYDVNNANNKFVISEIDAKYLDTGIQIVKSSKRNY